MHSSIALWSHPRSMSTAMERMFIRRGDFHVFHEEFAYVFFMHEQRADIPYRHPADGHPRTYRELRDMMEAARAERPVFHKDFPYHVFDHLRADRDYLRGQVNTFLIRDPREAVRSHATVHPGLTREVLGYEALAGLFDLVCDLTGDTPPVINAADLAVDPAGTVAAYCTAAGIDFRPDALTWSPGEQPEWATWKEWHVDAARSNGFHQPARQYAFDFDDMPQLREFVDYCDPFYRHLDRFRVHPTKELVT